VGNFFLKIAIQMPENGEITAKQAVWHNGMVFTILFPEHCKHVVEEK
jgi:hypothetical protein